MAGPLKLPPGAVLVDDGTQNGGMKLPPGATLVNDNQSVAPQKTPGFLSRAWDFANKGLVSGDTLLRAGNFATGGAIPSPEDIDAAATPKASDSPFLAGVRSFTTGAAKDTANVASGFTSPASIAMLGAGAVGKIPGTVGMISRAIAGTAGAGYGAQGAYSAGKAALDDRPLSNPDKLQEMLFGGAQAAGGAAGVSANRTFANAPIMEAPSRLRQGISDSALSRALPGSPQELLTRATKPNVGLSDYQDSLTNTLPELAKWGPRSLTGLTQAADLVKDSANTKYQGLLSRVAKPVDLTPAADAQMHGIPATNLFEDPDIAARTQKVSDIYRTSVPAQQANAIRVDTNAKLRSFWNKDAGDRSAAMSNPEVARTAAVNSGVRDSLYGAIKNETGIDPTPIQNLYGDAVDVGDTAGRRNTVFSRQQPISLQEGLLGPLSLLEPTGGLAFGASKLFKTLNDPDFQVKTAFNRYNYNQRPTPPTTKWNPGSLAAAIAANRR